VKILVLGLGNDLYGDDGIGVHAVRILRDEWKAAKRGRPRRESTGRGPRNVRVDFIECALSGIALLDVISGYDALIIVDTIIKRKPVTGRIHLLGAEDIRSLPGPSPHYVSVPQTIAIGARLNIKMPSIAKIVAVETKSRHHLGEGLSPEMKRRLPAVVGRTRSVLLGLLSGSLRRICP
jgi:hydrogenase maturation protease